MKDFISRKKELEYIESFCSDDNSNLLFITGDTGVGKTTLVSEFAEKNSPKYWLFSLKPERVESPNNYVFQWLNDFFTGRAFFNGSSAWEEVLQQEIKIKDFIKMALAYDKASMEFRLVEVLERISSLLSKNERMIIIIDPNEDLDGEKNIALLQYIAKKIPQKVKIILVQNNNTILNSVKCERVDVLRLSTICEYEAEAIVLKSGLFDGSQHDLIQKLSVKSKGNFLYINSAINALKHKLKFEPISENDITALPDELDDLLYEIYDSILDKDSLDIIHWASIIPGKINYELISFLTSFSFEKIENVLGNDEIKLMIKTEDITAGNDCDVGNRVIGIQKSVKETIIKPLHHAFYEMVKDNSEYLNKDISERYKKLSAYYQKKIVDKKNSFEDLMYYHLCIFLSKDQEGYVKASGLLIEKLYTLKLRDSCIEILDRVVKYCIDNNDKKEFYVEFINHTGIICHEQRHLERALDYFNEALVIYKELKDKSGEASVLGNLGIVYRDIFKTDKACEFLQAALDIYIDFKDKEGQSHILTQMWKIDYEINNYGRAIWYLLRLLVLTKELGYKKRLGSVLGNIGNLYTGLKDYDRAVVYYEQALDVSCELGDVLKVATYLSRIGSAYLYNDLCLESLEFFSNSLKVYQKLGNIQGEASQYGNIGLAYKNINEFDTAISYFKNAKDLFTKRASAKHVKLMQSNIDAVEKIKKEKDKKTNNEP